MRLVTGVHCWSSTAKIRISWDLPHNFPPKLIVACCGWDFSSCCMLRPKMLQLLRVAAKIPFVAGYLNTSQYRLYSEIDHIHLSSEAQCVSHHLPQVDCHIMPKDNSGDIWNHLIINYDDGTLLIYKKRLLWNKVPSRQFWDCGRWKSDSLWNFSIVGCQFTVNCLRGHQ